MLPNEIIYNSLKFSLVIDFAPNEAAFHQKYRYVSRFLVHRYFRIISYWIRGVLDKSDRAIGCRWCRQQSDPSIWYTCSYWLDLTWPTPVMSVKVYAFTSRKIHLSLKFGSSYSWNSQHVQQIYSTFLESEEFDATESEYLTTFLCQYTTAGISG